MSFRLILSWICLLTSTFVFGQENIFHWKRSTPEDQGMSYMKLDQLSKQLQTNGTKKFLVIKNDHIVYEWYDKGWADSTRRHYSASLAKGLIGGTALALVQDDGLLFPDMPVCNLIPAWKSSNQKSKISVRHLATHTSGLEDAEVDERLKEEMKAKKLHPHKDLKGWKGHFWRQDVNPFLMSRDSTPVLFTPGTHFNYSNPGMAMLGYVITASMVNTPYNNIEDLLWNRIFKPIGIDREEISMGYGRQFETDGLQLTAIWGGGGFTANAAARIARLMINRGQWEGKSLLSSRSVKELSTYGHTAIASNDSSMVSEFYSLRTEKNSYPATTLGWYSNFDGVWNHVPNDAFAAAGAGHQVVLAVPSLDLIVVRLGADLGGEESEFGFWSLAEKQLFNPIMDAIEENPYPKDPEISSCTFQKESETIRMAEGSDNWPTTWAHDGNVYTAYGDGWGFEPKVGIKLSLGLSRIEGSPPTINGINIRSNSGERVGQGRYGVKSSGMLALNGSIYMLVRNAGNAQVVYSEDLGKTWLWSDWRFEESFGCPTFLNVGMDHEGAKDEYVYIYSPDAPSAYNIADQMVLARVPKDKILMRKAYQFFAGFAPGGSDTWTEDIKKRAPVFSNPGKCYRSGISFNQGMQKYIWTQIIPLAQAEEGPRFRGGLGIFTSDTPWGPWKTAYYTREWDMGPGDSTSMPCKWISADGRTAYLLFSGNDFLSVRGITFNK